MQAIRGSNLNTGMQFTLVSGETLPRARTHIGETISRSGPRTQTRTLAICGRGACSYAGAKDTNRYTPTHAGETMSRPWPQHEHAPWLSAAGVRVHTQARKIRTGTRRRMLAKQCHARGPNTNTHPGYLWPGCVFVSRRERTSADAYWRNRAAPLAPARARTPAICGRGACSHLGTNAKKYAPTDTDADTDTQHTH